MSKYQSRIDRNESRNCSLLNCFNRRKGLSGYCSIHARKLTLYGSPLAVAILKQDYEREVEEVNNFIQKHSEHPAVITAIDFFDNWLEEARKGNYVPAQEQFKKLYGHRITGKNCVQAFLSIWLYSSRNQSKLPDDIRLTYRLAVGIFELKDRSKVNASIKREVGTVLRQSLGVFALNVIKAVERDIEIKEVMRNNLLTPFKENTIDD